MEEEEKEENEYKDDNYDNDNGQAEKDNANPILSYLGPSLQNYFKIYDIGSTGFIGFSGFIRFLKYLKLWDKLNESNNDPRGITNTNTINCKQILYKNRS
jgi:hypothetical protein